MKSLERLRAYARTFTGTTKYEIEDFADDVALEVERDYVKREVHDEAIRLKLIDIGVQRARANELESERDEWRAKCERQAEAIGEWELRCERLESECDEWKRKAVSKSAKRAAAVERLKASPSDDTFEKIIAAAIGCTPLFITTRKTRDMFIDLLTDDDANDESAPKDDVSANDVDANDANADSREKLESDIADSLCLFAHYAHDHYERETVMQMVADRKSEFTAFLDRQATITRFQETSNQPNSGFVAQKQPESTENDTAKSEIRDFDDTREKLEADIAEYAKSRACNKVGDLLLGRVVRCWLDRQASITERECWPNLRDGFNEQHARADELQEQLDEATRALNEAAGKWAKAKALVDELREEAVELRKENTALIEENGDLQAKLDEANYQIDELTAERDAFKGQLDAILDNETATDAINAGLANKLEELERENAKLQGELDARMYWVNLADRIDELEAENARLSSDELHWRSEAKRLEGELKTQRNNFDQATGARDYWKEKLGILLKRLSDMGCKVGSINDVPIEVELPRRDEGLA